MVRGSLTHLLDTLTFILRIISMIRRTPCHSPPDAPQRREWDVKCLKWVNKCSKMMSYDAYHSLLDSEKSCQFVQKRLKKCGFLDVRIFSFWEMFENFSTSFFYHLNLSLEIFYALSSLFYLEELAIIKFLLLFINYFRLYFILIISY